ncbi:uncharacterized protein LOC131332735 [Rhododendron vialii]|uniref:uncharacterized protein LOC131332735 n=1 Tax=Rhododendron vialii TaxID=182163 RepID=UPI00265F07DF|nr:uncharacterized protein LOC131332735 [Rhododendron vialii]
MRGQIGKWSLALMEFSFQYIPQKAVKGQALADFLADPPCVDIDNESEQGLNDLEISLTPWTLLFDGSRTQEVSGSEYEAVVIGLEILRDLEAREVQVIGDSNLVINHLVGTFKCYSEDLAPYYMAAMQLIQDFDNVTVKHLSRNMNTEANSLAQASTGLRLAPETIHKIITVQNRLLLSLRRRGLGLEVFKVRRRAMGYVLVGDELYKKSFENDLLLRCFGHPEAMRVMSEVHEGICGAHQSGIKMRWLIRRYGYYWPTILEDCIRFSKGCQPRLAHGPIQRVLIADYHAVVKPWPFRGWALDVIGKIYPPSSENHTYILVATGYFTKWAETVPLKSVDQQEVIKVIKERIIHRFGLPEHLVADRGTIFMGEQVVNFTAQQNIIMSNFTPYYAQGNG